MKKEFDLSNSIFDDQVCEPLLRYTRAVHQQLSLFADNGTEVHDGDIRVVELFAGVGGFRIGLERASQHYKTVWSNQWEPATKRQDASIIYRNRFGEAGHSNEDINTVPTDQIPECDLLVGGFPCQDYSVATTLKRSGGIEGKKGVLWWQIHRIIDESKHKPDYLFFENVDRLLKSPATQRGRDFAIILASLSDLGYIVEWRVINAAEYGMPQRRRRTYIVAYRKGNVAAQQIAHADEDLKWVTGWGVMAKAFPCRLKDEKVSTFDIQGDLVQVSAEFNKGKADSPFGNTGIMRDRKVVTLETAPVYDGIYLTLGDLLIDESLVPEAYFIKPEELAAWRFQKGAKSLKRVNKATGFEYNYSEGGMAFPDFLDRPSRTIITGEGGAGASRFKHVVQTPSGRYRRLVPVELERLNMFPDNHTREASDARRAFLMGNALVTGIVEKIGLSLLPYIQE